MINILNAAKHLYNSNCVITIDGVNTYRVNTISVVVDKKSKGHLVVGGGVLAGHEIKCEKGSYYFGMGEIVTGDKILTVHSSNLAHFINAFDGLLNLEIDLNNWDALSNLLKNPKE